MDGEDGPETTDADTGGRAAFLGAAREFLTGAAQVVAIGLLLFAVSGVWPPLVAVESGSMEPNMVKGDMIFVMEEGRFPGEADRAGVVTHAVGQDTGYRTFGGYGDVIVFRPADHPGPPIIHRARFWVEEGENWYDRADQRYLVGDSCEAVANCPAPHDGFITKGDANSRYDQTTHVGPVRPSWVVGKAKLRVPYLGWVRLALGGKI